MEPVQYSDLSAEAKKTLFAARRIHGFNDAQGEDFEAWAQKFVIEFSAKGESALLALDPFLRMYFTRSAKVCYVDLDPRNDRDHGGLAFTAAAALEAVPGNMPMLDIDGDHCICAVKVRVGGEEMYISVHEAEMTRAVVIDMAISIDQLEKLGIKAPTWATSCSTSGKKISYYSSSGIQEDRDLVRKAAVDLRHQYGIDGPLRCAISGAGR